MRRSPREHRSHNLQVAAIEAVLSVAEVPAAEVQVAPAEEDRAAPAEEVREAQVVLVGPAAELAVAESESRV